MITATQAIGRTFDSHPIQIFGTALAVMLVVVWIFVFGMMIRAFVLKRLLWPGGVDGAEAMTRRWTREAENVRKHLHPLRSGNGVLQN